MKEYKTEKVPPEKEEVRIRYYETFGWKLEETREVYSESQEIVGVDQTVRRNDNAFMRGFTGNDANVTATVRTQTNVTHFLSMRFSRDTAMKNYTRLKTLQEEFDECIFVPYVNVPEPPIVLTVVAVLGCMTIILPIAAILSWILYPKKKKKAIEENKEIEDKNAQIATRSGKILEEATRLSEESAAV